jgi:fructokinase
MMSVHVWGELIADFLPEDDEPARFRCVLGGSGFNTALALARLGLRPALIGSLSQDALGRRFARAMAAEGIDASLLAPSQRPMPVAIVSPGGESHGGMFALHLAGTAQEEAVDWGALRPAPGAHWHAASFAALVGASAEEGLTRLRAARALGSTSFDPNIRAACLPPRERTVALVEARVAAATLAKASDEDCAWLYPHLAPHEVVQRWAALGSAWVVVTRGARGALAMAEGEWVEAPAPAVAVADTVGAGDTVTAGLLAVLATHGRLGDAKARWEAPLLRAALDFALAAASDTCRRPGCDPLRWRAPGPAA